MNPSLFCRTLRRFVQVLGQVALLLLIAGLGLATAQNTFVTGQANPPLLNSQYIYELNWTPASGTEFKGWTVTGSATHIIIDETPTHIVVKWTSQGNATVTCWGDNMYPDDSSPFSLGSVSVNLNGAVACSTAGTYNDPVLLGSINPCASPASTRSLTFDTRCIGNVQAYYTFHVSNYGQVEFTGCGPMRDPIMTLRQVIGNMLAPPFASTSGVGAAAGCVGGTPLTLSRALTPGDYLLMVQGGAATNFDVVQLSVNARPLPVTLSVSDDQHLPLSGGTVQLRAAGAVSYRWTPDSYLNTNTGTTVVASPRQTITYTVTGFDCTGGQSQQKQVTVHVPLNNLNYVTTRTALEPGKVTESSLYGSGVGNVGVSTVFMDGLGRAMQTVVNQASPAERDIVQPVAYDPFGRSPRAYLPYVNGTDGRFKTDAFNATTGQPAFYNTNGQVGTTQIGNLNVAHDAAAYAETVFEASPLNRPVEQGAPGTAWQPNATGTGHTQRSVNRANRAGEVRLWEVGSEPKAVSSPGYYGAGQLAVLETRDENDRLSLTYADAQGRVVQKKVQEAATATSTSPDAAFLITQYIHDDLGNLRLVISPEGTRSLPQPSGAGLLAREVWLGTGTTVSSIRLGAIPDNFRSPITVLPANAANALSSFEAPIDVEDDYGQRIRGYVTAPVSGNYTFWIASDDKSELWLSTSESPTQKQRIAMVTNWTPSRIWNLEATQESAPVTLIGGLRYYIEALQKDGIGGDNLAVKWRLPNGSEEMPIPSNRLSTEAIRLSAVFVDTWCFRYEYDDRQRLIEKQVPGAGPERLVYNRRDQVVLTNRANQGNQWQFVKYDALGRPVMTGLYSTALSRAALQTEVDGVAGQWEDAVVNATDPTKYDYTLTRSAPTSVTDNNLLTRTYYDSYTHTALAAYSFVAENGVPADQCSPNVTGQVTGRSEKVLDGNASPWLTTVVYYDDKYRTIQTQQQLYSLNSSTPSGTERTTLLVDFAGRTTKSLTTHVYPTSSQTGATPQTVLQEFDYDHASRVTDIRQQITGQDKIVLAHYDYNELGQLVDKKLHSTALTPAGKGTSFLQSVDHRYNIRGWLANINDRNLSNNGTAFNGADPNADLATEHPDLFGMELMYHDNQNLPVKTPQYNGNISEVMWRTRNVGTGNTLRGYAYRYDAASRLSAADYRTYEGAGTWAVHNNRDYSVDNISYDANGNLKSMNRMGQTSAPGQTTGWGALDQLTYAHEGNRLVAVDDAVATAATHDFEDVTGAYAPGSAPEYTYDAAGYLVSDQNKGIDYISYNALNKPEYIYFNGYSQYIQYVYSASGAKLLKHTVDYSQPTTVEHVTDYAGGFVYEDKALKFAPTPEGRLLYTHAPSNGTLKWKYEYHLKDHLGNLRFAFTDEGNNTSQRTAGMEPANASEEEQSFGHVAETRLRDAAHARSGEYVARLDARTGRHQGPSIRLAIAAGDSIHAEAYGRYDRTAPLALLAQKGAVVAGAAVIGGVGQTASDQQQALPGRRRRLPFLGASLAVVPELLHLRQAKVPTAFLQYELFDQDSQLVATRTVPLQRTARDEWQHLQTGLRADSAGYVQVSLLNESGAPAYFDDVQLRLTSLVVQENHYDPFGLNLVGIEATSGNDSKFQYNGKEKQEDFGLNWSDYGARMYDAQLGRWHAVDPLADMMRRYSPYVYCFDNPIRFIDPDGMQVIGSNNKRVTYGMNVKTGVLEFSSNATADITTLVSALYKTPEGIAAAERMMNSSTKISLKISSESKTESADYDESKIGPVYAQGNPGRLAEDGSYETYQIVVYKGTYDAEKAGTLPGEPGQYSESSENRMYNGVMVHEEDHIGNDATVQDEIDNCKGCTDKQRYEISERSPNARELKSNNSYNERHPR